MTRAIDQAQLTWVRSQAEQMEPGVMRTVVSRRMYPDLVPIKRDINPAADSITTKVRNAPKGRIQPLANMAADQPTASVDYRYVSAGFISFGVSYGYSSDDIDTARMTGTPLETDEMESAMEIVEQAKEDIVMHGREEFGWKGLFQTGANVQPGVLKEDGVNWNTATTEDILEDIQKAFTKVAVNSDQTMLPDTLLIPQSMQSLITKPLANDVGITSTSLMSFMRQNNPYTASMQTSINIMVVPKLDPNIAIMYKRDPMVCRLLMPRELQWAAPEIVNGWNVKRIGRIKMGGVQFLRPYGICHLTGINGTSIADTGYST